MPPRHLSNADPVDAAAVARFRADLARLCPPGAARPLVAVSGGGDSLALLLLTHAALGDAMAAATVDHGLRPEAGAEAAFVAAICRDRGIAHTTLSGEVPPRIGRTANLSVRARALRYRLLAAHAAATGRTHVATAHHADDQAETIAMRLNRGAGVAGLAGIRASVGGVVRPLLGWRRAELARIVAAASLAPVVDPTNTDDRFDRARLRKRLAAADWVDVAGWGRSAAATADAELALRWVVRGLFAARTTPASDGIDLRLGDAPAEIARRLVVACLATVQPGIAPRGDALTRLVATIRGGGRAMLGDVAIDATDPARIGFRRAPSRRDQGR